MIAAKSVLRVFSAMIVVVAFAAAARADLVVTVTAPGYGPVSFNGPLGANPIGSRLVAVSGPAGPFSVSVLSQDNGSSPNAAEIFTNTIEIRNTGNNPGDLTVDVADAAFSMPAGTPITLKTVLNDSKLTGPLDTATDVAYISSGAGLFSTLPVMLTGPTPLLGVTASASGARLGDFTLGNTITIHLEANSQANLTITTDASVPEPSRLVGMLGMGALMGLGLLWQGRRSLASQV